MPNPPDHGFNFGEHTNRIVSRYPLPLRPWYRFSPLKGCFLSCFPLTQTQGWTKGGARIVVKWLLCVGASVPRCTMLTATTIGATGRRREPSFSRDVCAVRCMRPWLCLCRIQFDSEDILFQHGPFKVLRPGPLLNYSR